MEPEKEVNFLDLIVTIGKGQGRTLVSSCSNTNLFKIPSIDNLIRLKQIRKPNVKDEQDIEYLLKAKQLLKLEKI
jgi:hypothetical protein